MRDSLKTPLAVLAVLVIAGVFWIVLISPKRDKANELSEQANAISNELSADQTQLSGAESAKKNFSPLYRKLVVLGKAVPPEAGTASLLVQLQGISDRAETSFHGIQLGTGGGGEGSESSTTGSSETSLPLGATLGAQGLATMTYSLEFNGGYFEIAKFIKDLDALVETKNQEVDANGRLVTINGFAVSSKGENSGGGGASSGLEATFQVTTYVAPTGQGLTAGATEAGPTAADPVEEAENTATEVSEPESTESEETE
jgi:Tfp pilus assembly protein PilO